MEEIWKNIQGYEGIYKISNLGRVMSFANYKEGRILKQNNTKFSRHITIKGKTYSIFRLVAREHLYIPYGDKRLRLKDTNRVNGELLITTDNISIYTPKIDMKYFNRYKGIMMKICNKHNLLLEQEVLSNRRDKYIQKGRAECYIALYRKSVKLETIAKIFNKNHAAIIYTLNKYYGEEYRQLVDKYK